MVDVAAGSGAEQRYGGGFVRHVLIMSAVTLLGLTVSGANATSVDIIVSGTQQTGRIFGEVFASAESFKARERAVERFTLEPAKEADGAARVRTTLSLPPGRYAVAMFQDTKGTGKLETNMFGVPVVPYGFSNNARGRFAPPGFDAASFEVGATRATVAIELR
jgi:uncharacterized protein (DUF2141 family)